MSSVITGMIHAYGGLDCPGDVMRLEPSPCPRCNSSQQFGVKTRVKFEPIVELYISCTKCKWESVIDSGTRKDLRLRADIMRLKQKYAVTGDPSILATIERRIRRLGNS